MSPENPDPFDALPVPLLSPSLVREYVRTMAAQALWRERGERAAGREARRRETPEWRGSPRGQIEAQKQRELARLTDDNAREVRARLKELNLELKALAGPDSTSLEPMAQFARSIERLALAAWDEAIARDEDFARRWRDAFGGADPELLEAIRQVGEPVTETLSMIVGHVMLQRAAQHDPEFEKLRDRISRVRRRDSGTGRTRS